MALSRDEIIAAIAARKAEVIKVSVPEWGGDVFIRRLSAAEVESSGLSAEEVRPTDVAPRVIAMSLTDADAVPIFTEGDVDALADADMAVVARVFAECIKVNGLGSAELDEAIASFTDAQPGSSSSS